MKQSFQKKAGLEGSHLPGSEPIKPEGPVPLQVGTIVPNHDFNERGRFKPEPKPKSNRTPPLNPLLRQLTTILDSVFIAVARKNAGHHEQGSVVAEISYQWHKGMFAAEEEYSDYIDQKAKEEENEKTKA